MQKREEKIIEIFAHEFKDKAMSEYELASLLQSFLNAINCNHQCNENCERSGCNCDCGYRHID